MKNLNKIKNEVKAINKGYSCNFNYKGTEINFINGANTLCFTVVDDKVKFHTVGGSRFYYNDMKIQDFIKNLRLMLLTSEECDNVYREIACQILENANCATK